VRFPTLDAEGCDGLGWTRDHRLACSDPGRTRYQSKTRAARAVGETRHKQLEFARLSSGLAFAMGSSVNTPELDAAALVERIAFALGDCLGVGSVSRKTGELATYYPRSEHWAAVLSKAKAGTGWAFPGVRLASVAALINRISSGQASETLLEPMSVVARGSRIIFQRCPWSLGQVLFAVFPDDGEATQHFALLRRVLESVRRDVAIVQAPRAEAHCWN